MGRDVGKANSNGVTLHTKTNKKRQRGSESSFTLDKGGGCQETVCILLSSNYFLTRCDNNDGLEIPLCTINNADLHVPVKTIKDHLTCMMNNHDVCCENTCLSIIRLINTKIKEQMGFGPPAHMEQIPYRLRRKSDFAHACTHMTSLALQRLGINNT